MTENERDNSCNGSFSRFRMSRQCRFCLGTEPTDLISPCLCSGTQAFVHRDCLDKWRATSQGAFYNCQQCKHAYKIEYVPYRGRVSQTCAFWLMVTRDFLAVLVLMQALAAACGGIVYGIDARVSNETRTLRSLVFPDSMSDLGAYYLLGWLFGLAVLGLLTSIAVCFGALCFKDCDFCMCWYPAPSHSTQCCCVYTAGPDTCDQGSDGCGRSPSCGHNNCDSGGGHDDGGEALVIIMLLFVVVLAVIGLAALIYFLAFVLSSIARRHMHVLERRMTTKLQRVVDLQGTKGDAEEVVIETAPLMADSFV